MKMELTYFKKLKALELVETSWALGVSRNLINADVDNDLLYNHIKRTDVTSARDALNGYQKVSVSIVLEKFQFLKGH